MFLPLKADQDNKKATIKVSCIVDEKPPLEAAKLQDSMTSFEKYIYKAYIVLW